MPPVDPPTGWSVVLPVKGGERAKSRLRAGAGLALAIARDTVAATLACPAVARAVVVTADPGVRSMLGPDGAVLVEQPVAAPGLLGAVRTGLSAVPDGPVAVLLADVPALRPQDLAAALTAATAALAVGSVMAAVADADDTGTVMLAAARPADLRPAFGPDSLIRHRDLGARVLDVDLPRLRRDVDTAADLEVALTLGVGRHTRRAMDRHRPAYPGRMQATVHHFDPATGAGSLLTDDGLVLAFGGPVLATSGLRHLRTGQRLTVRCGPDGAVTDLRLGGIGLPPPAAPA